MEDGKRVTLYYRDEASDKEYTIWLEQAELPGEEVGAVVQVRYGRRGGTQNEWNSGPITEEKAEKIYSKKLGEKINKGYKPGEVDLTDPRQVAAAVKKFEAVTEQAEDLKYPPELLSPIEARETMKYVSDGRYLAQDKRNGHRRLVVKDGPRVYGVTRPGRVVELPEPLASEVRSLPYRKAVLDGELEGDTFTAFDALRLNLDLSMYAYEDRFRALGQAVAGLPHIVLVETADGSEEKLHLVARLTEDRAEGVVFKLRSATYRPGRNGQHVKLKFWKTATVRISNPRGEGKDSAVVQLLDGGEWRDVGAVSLIGKPAVVDGSLVEIKYLYATKARKVVQPTLLMVRDDVPESDCTIGQLRVNRDEE